jgi:mRNA interferase MazF
MKHKIVLVPFPFDDLSATKVRPAACLTYPIGIHQHVVLAFITSRIVERPLETDIVIHPDSPDFAVSGLRVASTLQLHRLLTVTRPFIRRELGELSPDLKIQVEERLRRMFDLPRDSRVA